MIVTPGCLCHKHHLRHGQQLALMRISHSAALHSLLSFDTILPFFTVAKSIVMFSTMEKILLCVWYLSSGAGGLSSSVSIVTGASRGIGKGIALELGRKGGTVYVVGRSSRGKESTERALPSGEELTVEATAEAVSKLGGVGIPMPLDASDDAALSELVSAVERDQGRLDMLVCSAFTTPPNLNEASFRGDFWLQGAPMWDACHGVGLRSAYVLCCAAVPLMIETATKTKTRRPLIALVSSFGGKSYTFNVAYGVGKAATDRLAKDMAAQLADRGVDTVSVYPGVVSTEGNLELERRGEWAAASGGLDFTETPEFTGRVLAHYFDNERGKSGSVQVVAELAPKFGITDVDGSQPASIRSLKFLVPNYVVPDSSFDDDENGRRLKKLRDSLTPDYLLPWSFFAEPPPSNAT